MTQVFLICFVINQNIVEKNNYKFAQVRLEDTVHGGLEGGWAIAQAKRYHVKLIVVVMCYVLQEVLLTSSSFIKI